MSRYEKSVYDLSFEEVAASLGDVDGKRFFELLYRPGRGKLPPGLAAFATRLGLPVSTLQRETAAVGSMTTKYIFGLPDGGAIEAVRIKRRTGFTACISSQVGCGFGCRFCASGRLGLKRHLTSGEIVQQVMSLGRGINRVVFMGIGEPLHNYDNVIHSIHTLRDRRGLNLSSGGVTISTIGIPKALVRLREEHLKINLTVSLHATTNAVRHSLIPGSKSHDIDEVVDRSLSWGTRHGRPVTYVYLLLPGINDTDRDIAQLKRWFTGQPGRINLMRWNPVEGGDIFRRADERTVSRFRVALEGSGISTTLRDTQGRDVDAACGQLWLRRELQPPVASRAQPVQLLGRRAL